MTSSKGLIVNNISGSERGPLHGDSPLIAVTGSIVFSKHGNFDLSLLDQDVSFFVDGTPGDNSTKAKFAGDVKISGSFTAESEAEFNSSVTIKGNTIANDDVIVISNKIYFCEDSSDNRIVFEDESLKLISDNDIVLTANDGSGSINIVGRLMLAQSPSDEWEAVNKKYVDDLLGEGFKISDDASGEPSTTITNNDTIYFLSTPDQTNININENEVTFGLTNDIYISGSLTVGESFNITSEDFSLKLSGSNLELNSNNDLIINPNSGKTIIQNNSNDFLIFDGDNNRIIPALDSIVDLGSEDFRFANIFTGDLHLRNERGHWQIVEERDHLTIINRLTDEKFSFVLEPYEPDNE
jgi:hypothetical protein